MHREQPCCFAATSGMPLGQPTVQARTEGDRGRMKASRKIRRDTPPKPAEPGEVSSALLDLGLILWARSSRKESRESSSSPARQETFTSRGLPTLTSASDTESHPPRCESPQTHEGQGPSGLRGVVTNPPSVAKLRRGACRGSAGAVGKEYEPQQSSAQLLHRRRVLQGKKSVLTDGRRQ